MKHRNRGFTLIEMIAVMSITAIVGAMVAVFLRLPLQSYDETERRAGLTDTADTAFTFIKRDLRTALPNSVRVSIVGSTYYLEFLKVRASGRYRSASEASPPPASGTTCADTDGNGVANENVFSFGVADTCFTTFGTVPDLGSIAANADFAVVYNLGPGFTGADAYATGAVTGGNKSLITSASAGSGGENVIALQSHAFNLESPARRFHVVSGPVTYACDPTAGTLRRLSGYAISAAQPTPPAGSSSLLAQGVTACTVTYTQNVINQRTGIVSIWLRIADGASDTTVSLFQQVQVSNDT